MAIVMDQKIKSLTAGVFPLAYGTGAPTSSAFRPGRLLRAMNACLADAPSCRTVLPVTRSLLTAVYLDAFRRVLGIVTGSLQGTIVVAAHLIVSFAGLLRQTVYPSPN